MGLFSKKKLYAVTPEKIYDISDIKAQIKAMDEGEKLDILSTIVTQSESSSYSDSVDKNNFKTYKKQQLTIYRMYNNEVDYGGELLRTVLSTRVSFIAGEGISVKASRAATLKFVEKLLKDNKMLEGSRLLKAVLMGEMDGSCLLRVSKKADDKIKISMYSNYLTPYDIQHNESDIEEYSKAIITLDKNKGQSEENSKTLTDKEFVYVKLGGSPDKVNDTPPKVANVLTDIESFSRAKYDMRKNNHLFGRVTPIFLVENMKEALSLQAKVNSMNSVIGKSYAGTAKQVFYLEPSGNSQTVLEKEMISCLRIIGTNMGIPIQFLSYPDLLSNRATAENMLEMVNSSIVQERLIWEEALIEIVQKAMVIADELGIPGAVNDPEGFEIKLNFASLSLLKQIAEVWLPLFDAELISKISLLSMLPGINVNKEIAFLKKEKEERIANAPTIFQNNANKKDGNQDQNNNQDDSQNDNQSET